MPPTRFSHSLSRRTFVRSIAGIGTLAIPGVTLAQSEPVLPAGTYTIRQKSTNRYVDARDSADWDYGIVTRGPQNNSTEWPMGPFSQAPKWYLRICSWRSRRLPRSRWHRS